MQLRTLELYPDVVVAEDIDLSEHRLGWRELLFTSADLMIRPYSELARVISLNTQNNQSRGHSIDLGKHIFLDHPYGDSDSIIQEEHAIVAKIANIIWSMQKDIEVVVERQFP